MQEIKEFAPVIIPTLNRYEHLKRCLESLEQCTWADKTDVYVALDFPPSDKYVEGWKKIDSYLKEKEQSNGFKKLIVYRRKENYFFSGKGNLATAIKDLPEGTGCYIVSEDDNEFSPCFLDYMNKALTRYWDDERVTSVSGYNYPIDMGSYDKNIYAHHQFSAWGVGRWRHKKIDLKADYAKEILSSFDKTRKLLVVEPALVFKLMKMIARDALYGDLLYSSYNVINRKLSIFPSISLCRNFGHDGSGLHCNNSDPETDIYACQPISSDSTFEIDQIEVSELNIPELKNYFSIEPRLIVSSIVLYISYLLRRIISAPLKSGRS